MEYDSDYSDKVAEAKEKLLAMRTNKKFFGNCIDLYDDIETLAGYVESGEDPRHTKHDMERAAKRYFTSLGELSSEYDAVVLKDATEEKDKWIMKNAIDYLRSRNPDLPQMYRDVFKWAAVVAKIDRNLANSFLNDNDWKMIRELKEESDVNVKLWERIQYSIEESKNIGEQMRALGR